jgi:hypothetical protein
MATIIVAILCIVLIVVGGMALSQGILATADATAFSFDRMRAIEVDMMRTEVVTLRAEYLSWSDLLRVTVDNNGQTKLGSFDKWDFIVHYHDDGGSYYSEWLPYTEGAPGDNEWQKAGIYLNGQPESFEPGLLNHGEELVIIARISPLPGTDTTGNITMSTPNGVCNTASFFRPGYTLLTPHSENTTIAGVEYYQLAEASPGDGSALTETTDAFVKNEVARKMLHHPDDASRPARHVFPLTGISEIPAQTWTVYYRCQTWGDPKFPNKNGDVNFDIDILVRESDGSIRTTIASDVADAYLTKDEVEIWITKSATYDFPGYTVVDDSDYLEIVYYGETDSGGPQEGPGYLQIRIDDDTVAEGYQTRIDTKYEAVESSYFNIINYGETDSDGLQSDAEYTQTSTDDDSPAEAEQTGIESSP